MQLSIIIVSYNVKFFLEQCLYSVQSACKNLESEIFVIDNASPDNTIEYLQPRFPSVKFIKNDLNEGFAKANNKALHSAKGKYVLFLNPDTIVAESTFLNCIKFLDEHSNAGAAGVQLIDGSGNFLPESKRAFPSALTSFLKLSGLAALFPHSAFFNQYALGNLDENKTHEVNVLPGAFLMARRNILFQLNGFDEDFFMYGEDIDLSYRIQQSGYKNFYLGEEVCVHFKGESMQTNKPEYVKNFYEAMKIFIQKHHKKPAAFVLKIAVAISKELTTLKHQFSSNKKIKNNYNFLLLANNEDIQSAEKILIANGYASQHTSSLKNVNASLLHNTNTAIVFCISTLCYAEAIRFMQKNKNEYVYFWHKANSQSIAGSSYSKAAGEIYVII